ncbi:cytochrome P450 [Ascobolus immersus RN42]|uniref:Cytochrome P450 n=1 Tax=Ascobolus immersus RN42 TaxID=1160509 RepID=A0A3N4HJC8_ASCIM|nr:cytochrome P450 [Ascobolus immersus RN42]
METVFERFSATPQSVTYAVGVVALAIIYNFVSYFRVWTALVDLPYVGLEKFSVPALWKASKKVNSSDVWDLVQEGYKKYGKDDQPFKLPTFGRNTVFLPAKYWDEIRSLPNDVASFQATLNDTMESKITEVESTEEEMHHSIQLIRGDLTQSIAHLVDDVQAEAIDAITSNLSDVTDDGWTQIPVFNKVLNIVAQTSARIFVGPVICKDESWIKETIMYTVNVFNAATSLKKLPWIKKKLFSSTVPEVKTLRASRQKAFDILRPEIARRRAAEKEAKENGTEWKEVDDYLEWIRRRLDSHPTMGTIQYQAKLQLDLSMAAIHTTSLTLTHIIFDLAANPQYIPELREEIRSVLATTGGKVTKLGMHKMSKLDSCMKESQRMNVLGLSMVSREIVDRKGLTLKSGLHLPYGTRVHTPHHDMLRDSNRWDDPEKFDPFRFHRLRQTPGKETHGQFVTTASDFTAFGHGKHACPGRFFASAELKGILIILLARYDLRLPEGVTERPESFKSGTSLVPNPMAMIDFKLRPASERFY